MQAIPRSLFPTFFFIIQYTGQIRFFAGEKRLCLLSQQWSVRCFLNVHPIFTQTIREKKKTN